MILHFEARYYRRPLLCFYTLNIELRFHPLPVTSSLIVEYTRRFWLTDTTRLSTNVSLEFISMYVMEVA